MMCPPQRSAGRSSRPCRLAALGFRLLSLVVRQVTLPIGFAGLAMLCKEFGGTQVSLGRLVMSGSRTLMTGDTLALLQLVLAVHFAHEAKALASVVRDGKAQPPASRDMHRMILGDVASRQAPAP
jgi:hypothetical protein